MDTILPDVDAQHLGDPARLGEYGGFEVYAMPAFVRFAAPDPAAVARWYVDALGFGVMYVAPEIGGVPALIHLRRRKYQDILVVPGEVEGGNVHLDATGEIETLAARSSAFVDHGGVVDTPYGPREVRLRDPVGHDVVLFAAPDRPTGTIDEAMEAAVERLTDA